MRCQYEINCASYSKIYPHTESRRNGGKTETTKTKKVSTGKKHAQKSRSLSSEEESFPQGNLTKIIVLVTKVCQENVQSVEDLIISKAALRKVKNVLSAENLIISKKCAQI